MFLIKALCGNEVVDPFLGEKNRHFKKGIFALSKMLFSSYSPTFKLKNVKKQGRRICKL